MSGGLPTEKLEAGEDTTQEKPIVVLGWGEQSLLETDHWIDGCAPR